MPPKRGERASAEEMEHWRKIARDSADLEREPSSEPGRVPPELIEKINTLREKDGLQPFDRDRFEDDPPELEFYRIARTRGLLQRRRRRT